VGLDAADWDVIRPLAASGRLPNLQRLMRTGATAVLQSEDPILSPILWTTIATGREPLDHGIYDFLEDDPVTGEPMRVSGRNRKVPALWDLFSDAGLTVATIGWWATWPAYPLRGTVVSDRVSSSDLRGDAGSPVAPGLVYPAELTGSLAALQVDPRSLGIEELASFAKLSAAQVAQADAEPGWQAREGTPHNPINNLRVILAATRGYHAMALSLLRESRPVLAMVYYEGIDGVCHLFAHCRTPAMSTCPPQMAAQFAGTIDAFYELQDRMLGELLTAAGPETVVAVVSDHGFQTGAGRPEGSTPGAKRGRARLWHRVSGVLILAGGPIVPAPLPPARIRDVTPTLLYLAGLPLAATLDGEALVGAVRPEFRKAHPVKTIPDYPPWTVSEAIRSIPADRDTDRQEMAKLAALGYLAESEASRTGPGKIGTIRNLTTEAYLRQRSGDAAEARKLLRRAVDLDPTYLPAVLALADLYRRGGDAEGALRLYRGVLADAWENDPRAYQGAAAAFIAARKTAEGLELLRPLEHQHQGVSLLSVAVAMLESAGGGKEEAATTLRAALARDPVSIEAMAGLWAILEPQGRAAEVQPLLARALELNPRSAPHHQWTGRLAEARSDWNAAALSYARATEAAPEQFEPLSDLGRVTARAGRLDAAAEIFRTTVKEFPQEPRAPFNLAVVLEQQQDAAGALDAYAEAERRGLTSAAIYGHLGRLSAALGKRTEAGAYYEKSLKLLPDQPRVRSALEALRQAKP
jgi:tetratricopeptide (TPR) repeat protein